MLINLYFLNILQSLRTPVLLPFPYKLSMRGRLPSMLDLMPWFAVKKPPKKKQIDQGIVMGFCVLFAFWDFFLIWNYYFLPPHQQVIRCLGIGLWSISIKSCLNMIVDRCLVSCVVYVVYGIHPCYFVMGHVTPYGVLRTCVLTKITWMIRHESHMYSRCKSCKTFPLDSVKRLGAKTNNPGCDDVWSAGALGKMMCTNRN